MLEFLRQTLVESQRGGLGTAVVDNLPWSDETGQTSDGDDVAVVLLDHVRHEFLDGPEVGDGVDFKGATDVGFGLVQNRPSTPEPGIVDENGRMAMFLADRSGNLLEICCGGDVALVEGRSGS